MSRREDTTSRDEAGAAEWAAILGASEWIGDDPNPAEYEDGGFDESKLCVRCEHGHGGHVCAWCSGAAS